MKISAPAQQRVGIPYRDALNAAIVHQPRFRADGKCTVREVRFGGRNRTSPFLDWKNSHAKAAHAVTDTLPHKRRKAALILIPIIGETSPVQPIYKQSTPVVPQRIGSVIPLFMARCVFCGKPLTNPASISEGVGPECLGRYQAVSACVAALSAQVAGVSEVALGDELIQRRMQAYERALKRNHSRDANLFAASVMWRAQELAGN